MTDPVNYSTFPMAPTLALFSSLTGGMEWIEEDDAEDFTAIRGLVSLVSSDTVGVDAIYQSSDSTTAYESQVSTRQVTLGLRVESFESINDARDQLENVRTAFFSNTNGACADLRSRNTSFIDALMIRRLPNRDVDSRRVFTAQMDFVMYWTSYTVPVDVGSVEHATITGTVYEPDGVTVDRTVVASF